MKKLFFAAILAAILTPAIHAQNADFSFSKHKNEAGADSYKFEVTGTNGSTATINNVNIKAVKDFEKSCKNAESIHWYVEAKGSVAYYFTNGKKGMRVYDKKGHFLYNILSYQEEFLPFEVRDLVKRTYYFDYTIDLVNEVQTLGKTFFVVNISDKTTLKKVSVYDGEMELLTDFKKTN